MNNLGLDLSILVEMPTWVLMVMENNKKQQDFIEFLLKSNARGEGKSHNPKAPFPKKWKPTNLRPMNRFLDKEDLYFLGIGIKDDHTKICQILNISRKRSSRLATYLAS